MFDIFVPTISRSSNQSQLLPCPCSYSVLRSNVLGKMIIMSYMLLIILYIVLVVAAGASLTNNDAFCGTLAAFVHYLTVVCLFWMFAEALFYILRLSSDFGGNMYTQRYFVITTIVCYGEQSHQKKKMHFI